MLILYYMPTCPFCQRVLQMAENLGVSLELKDISSDDAIKAELIEKGGEAQVPYLIDTEKEISMYESGDIIEYIRDNYAGKGDAAETVKPRIHVGSATCESCEG